MRLILFPLKIAKVLILEFLAWIQLFIRIWPEGPIGNQLRWFYWKRKIKLKGKGKISHMVNFIAPGLTSIGKNLIVSEFTTINSANSAGVYIGDNVLIGPNVYIRAANHQYSVAQVPIRKQGHDFEQLDYQGKRYSIIIEDDVWVGAYTILVSGAKIGKGSVIGAGSVVTKEIPPYSVAAGRPARIIKKR